MDEVTLGEVRLELRMGDIAAQHDLEAVVNAANAQLQPGGGVAGALHAAAGPGLAQECAPLAPIEPGEVVVSGGHDLPNARVLHALGPVYGQDHPGEELLAACYRRALRAADEHGVASVGFPAISAGAFGYPLREAAEVAVRTVAEQAPRLEHVRLVRFVLFASREHEAFRDALASSVGS